MASNPGGPYIAWSRASAGQAHPSGSVKTAREKLAVNVKPSIRVSSGSSSSDIPIGIPPLRPGGRNLMRTKETDEGIGALHSPPSPLSPTTPRSPVTPNGLSSTRRANPGAIGAAISKPAPPSPWPSHGARGSSSRRLNNSPTRDERRDSATLRPREPGLPSHIPSLAVPSRRDDRSATRTTNYWEDSFQTPRSGLFAPLNTPLVSSAMVPPTPSSASSRPTTSSSAASIPDFPAPGTMPTRKSLGPPSTRRGYSSYYSQSSFNPIPEEGVDAQRSHGSYASSHAIPSSWESDPRDVNTDADGMMGLHELDNGEEDVSPLGNRSEDERGLVRHASMGKRHRPSLTTIRSSDRMNGDEMASWQNKARSNEDLTGGSRKGEKDKKGKKGGLGQSAVAGGAAATAAALAAQRGPAMPPRAARPSLSRGRSSQTSSPSSGGTTPKRLNALTTDFPFPHTTGTIRSDLTSPTDTGNPRIVSGPQMGMLDSRRLPRLNTSAAPESEVRGSLTSLPELIRRATTLASVLDRGRPTSRFSLAGLGSSKDGNLRSPQDQTGSLSDLLASFPPPGLATPRDGSGSRGSRPTSNWPSQSPRSSVGDENLYGEKIKAARRHRQRRCCGIPLTILLLLMLGFAIVLTAIIVPLVVVVLPRQNQKDSLAQLANCQKQAQCMNGGTSVFTANACHCVCAQGFTGTRCTVQADQGCVSTSLTTNGDSSNNASVGSSIPRLLQEGSAAYHVPLNASILVNLFSTSNMSCGSENALVTFNGNSDPVSAAGSSFTPSLPPSSSSSSPSSSSTSSGSSSSSPSATSTTTSAKSTSTSASVTKRQDASSSEPSIIVAPASIPPEATSNGIVFASPTQAATLAGSAPSPSTTGTPLLVNENTLEFARISVLYILQQKSLDVAVAAQQVLQTFLGTSQSSGVVNAGGNISIDFEKLAIDLGNGTVGGSSAN